MKILILSPYPPYPPHGGGTMRIYQLIRGLARRYDLTCLSFVPDLAAEHALAPLQRICRVVVVRGPQQRSLAQRAWTTLASRLPDMALRNALPEYSTALRALLATESFDIIQAESIEMAGYLQQVMSYELRVLSSNRSPHSKLKTQKSKLVLDQFNAEYLLQKRAFLADAWQPSRWHAAAYSLAQWLKLARYEAQVVRECDAVLAVADEDRATLLGGAPGAQIGVVPNGVDTDYFSRAALRRERAGQLSLAGPTLVFSGTLDFRPNVDALIWFAHKVLPRLRARRPDLRLLVVGKRPALALHQLARAGQLILTGEVPDARPYIASATVYIVPMRIGGGVRLKLLEALALEAPVVSTRMGAEGVAGLRAGEHCLLADDPADFAAAVLRLIDDPELGQQLGAAGRGLVREHYDWSVIVPRLEAIYQDLMAASVDR
jgi:glycosyltransferase involved in cell wall biosynthesis